MSRKYNFVDNTADIAVQINGSSLEELFSAGADAWLHSVVDKISTETDDTIDIELSATSKEELLITFLNELNYLLITKKWICISIVSMKIDSYEEGWELSVELKGDSIKENYKLKNEIKSVTYHQEEIIKTLDEYSTLVVFVI